MSRATVAAACDGGPQHPVLTYLTLVVGELAAEQLLVLWPEPSEEGPPL